MSATTGRYAADVDRENAELHRLRGQVAAVRELHWMATTSSDRVDTYSCFECGEYWPCATAKALGEAQR